MKYVFLCMLSLLITTCVRKQERVQENNNVFYDIYLLIGQSNMAGRAPVTEELTDSMEGVFLFRNDSISIWEKAANPLNKYSTVRKDISQQKLGPGYSFAKAMSQAYPGRRTGLVVNARGGTSIKSWMPSANLYNEAVKRAQEASEWGEIKGILWHQGESDLKSVDHYLSRLTVMIDSLRKDLGNPFLPVVVGQIFAADTTERKLNELLLQVPQLIPNTAVVLSDSTTTFDNLHFDTGSQLLMGKRFAEAMISLFNP